MFGTIVIVAGGSASVRRAVSIAVDLTKRLDALIHALYVVGAGDMETMPDRLRDEMCDALTERGGEALAEIKAATDREMTVAVREGRPAAETSDYAREVNADAVAMGTRGRHGGNRFLIGNVAECIV